MTDATQDRIETRFNNRSYFRRNWSAAEVIDLEALMKSHMKIAARVNYREGTADVEIRMYRNTRNGQPLFCKSINSSEWRPMDKDEFRARAIYEINKIQ